MLDLLLQCLGIIRSFYFLLNTVVHKSHCVQDLISLWHDRKCRKAKLNAVLFPALLGLCVSECCTTGAFMSQARRTEILIVVTEG